MRLRILFFLCCAITSLAHSETIDRFKYPFYVGVTGGYGATTWQGLVPPAKKQNPAMAMSTPTNVSEDGAVWGLFAGYELLPYFALEAAYMRYPDAKVSFDPSSMFTFEHDGLTSFTTKTEKYSLIAKVMLIVPRTTVRVFSGLGLSETHRYDMLNDHWIGTPTFTAGLNYNVTPHVMTELGADYTAGKGQSELDPIDDYFPFLYSVFLRLAYRF